MTKTKLPIYIIVPLFLCVIICSLLSGVFIIPAIAFFSVLCVVMPSPYLAIAPLLSIVLTLTFNSAQSDFVTIICSVANSLSYVLPSVLTAVSYFKKYSKFQTVINGAAGLFIYYVVLTIMYFLIYYGSFGRDILNSVIDDRISEFILAMSQTVTQFGTTEQALNFDGVEQMLCSLKPLMPACAAAILFVISYISVCLSNSILKKAKVIENVSYRLVQPMACGVIFLAAIAGSTFSASDSFAYIVFASLTIILTPMFFITGTAVIFEALSKVFKNKAVSVILIAVILTCAGTIIYNLFYLIGCYYSIISGIRNIKSNKFKGGKK